MLRHTLGYLLQLLDKDEDKYFPEEVYLSPPLIDGIHTGSIVKGEEDFFIVLNPACDLVIRGNEQFKADRILLVKIEKQQDIVDSALLDIQNTNKKKSKLKQVLNNNYTDYHHWLPSTNFFDGGFLNFRHISTLPEEEFIQRFGKPVIQISPFFVKDVVARFSSYYARQGQPDIDYDDYVKRYSN